MGGVLDGKFKFVLYQIGPKLHHGWKLTFFVLGQNENQITFLFFFPTPTNWMRCL